MSAVRVSSDFGIIVRKDALERGGIAEEELFEAMEVAEPLDDDETLLSFGPHFGPEVVTEFIRRLEELGLVYDDDFVDFDTMLPSWCQASVALGVDPRGGDA